ncbi:MAG: 1-deoxy-D-xylulose-5-phosphate reductoisomerase [Bacteroidota bacterium]
MKNVAILGSTGSIGRNTLDVIASFPDEFRVTYLFTNKNVDLLCEQAERFHPCGIGVLDEKAGASLCAMTNGSLEVLNGEIGIEETVARDDVDIVVSSLVGFAGLRPTIKALENGKAVALATKEALVVAGELIMRLVRERDLVLIPIDSEHSAILQCLAGERKENVAKLILTASGGPFLGKEKAALDRVTVGEALNHPNWRMGNKITIDSATLMNKGLEVVEAHWLFGFPAERIEVVIHPQSIVHSMVEFIDGSVKAQLGVPDMRIPIQYALTYPNRSPSTYTRLDFSELCEMTFFKPDRAKFECLDLAYNALQTGGTATAVLNAANEVAVESFLKSKIKFSQIPRIIEKALSLHHAIHQPCLDDIIGVDQETRNLAASWC